MYLGVPGTLDVPVTQNVASSWTALIPKSARQGVPQSVTRMLSWMESWLVGFEVRVGRTYGLDVAVCDLRVVC